MNQKKIKKIIPKVKRTNINSSNKKKVKLKTIKVLTPFNFQISNVYVFPNKNFLVNTDWGYKIYNEKYQCIRAKENVNYNSIKIIDNDNFICLKDNTKLVNIGLKTGKIQTIFYFKEEISELLYHGDKYITCGVNDNIIKIWTKIPENRWQNSLKIRFGGEKGDIRIFLFPEKNILGVSVEHLDTYFF